MTTRFYRLGKLQEKHPLFDSGAGTTAREAHMHIMRSLKNARLCWTVLEDYLNADTMYSEASYRGVGFQFREEPPADIDAIFCKGNRHNGYVCRSLRAKTPRAEFKKIHAEVKEMIKQAEVAEAKSEFFVKDYDVWQSTGWRLLDLMLSGRLSLFPGVDDYMYFACSRPPRFVEFDEILGSEFDAALEANREQEKANEQ